MRHFLATAIALFALSASADEIKEISRSVKALANEGMTLCRIARTPAEFRTANEVLDQASFYAIKIAFSGKEGVRATKYVSDIRDECTALMKEWIANRP